MHSAWHSWIKRDTFSFTLGPPPPRWYTSPNLTPAATPRAIPGRKQSMKDSTPRIYACARCPSLVGLEESERLFTIAGIKSHLVERLVSERLLDEELPLVSFTNFFSFLLFALVDTASVRSVKLTFLSAQAHKILRKDVCYPIQIYAFPQPHLLSPIISISFLCIITLMLGFVLLCCYHYALPLCSLSLLPLTLLSATLGPAVKFFFTPSSLDIPPLQSYVDKPPFSCS